MTSSPLSSIINLERKYKPILTENENEEYGVSTRNSSDGIYDWFPMVQRFTRSFLQKIFQSEEVRNTKTIFDPFMGSGNTLVSCWEHGKQGYGLDVSPLFCFVTRVKTGAFIEEDFLRAKAIIDQLPNPALSSSPFPTLSSFKTLFGKKQLDNILKLRNVAQNLDLKSSELLLFALSSELVRLSKAKRDGKGLHRNIGRSRSAKPTVRRKLERMKSDYGKFVNESGPVKSSQIIPLLGDARNLKHVMNPLNHEEFYLPKGKIDCVITSPPYCNSADYVEMYKLEHWFLRFVQSRDEFRDLSHSTIRSHTTFNRTDVTWTHDVIGKICSALESDSSLWNPRIPAMIRGYFDDLHRSIGEIHDLLRPHGKVYLLVANSCYGGIPVPTDLLLAEAGDDQGFEVESIKKIRRLNTSGQQLKRMNSASKGMLRESLLILSSN